MVKSQVIHKSNKSSIFCVLIQQVELPPHISGRRKHLNLFQSKISILL